MRTILPRLRNLLAMLAAESAPLPVQEVADRLRVSRRTVFRELASIGSVLDGYELEVGSRPGAGILLEGPVRARTALLTDLEKLDRSDPADKRDRQDRLILAILEMAGQKLAVHAERFKVSVPTVSHDLDDIGPWLAERGLELLRRPGGGILIVGDEMRVRRIVLNLLHGMREPGAYPDPNILLDILDMSAELDPLLGWMTPQSRDALSKYLLVATQRLMDGCALENRESGKDGTEFSATASRLATVLSEAFNIRFSPAETAALEVELSACRPNVPLKIFDGAPSPAPLAALAGEMVALFDPEKAALLRMDEVLMEGLVNHLRTAVVRIAHKIEVPDPMLEEISRDYPDVMRRSRAACSALRARGDWLPDSEVSLFAAHFAAALLRLSEQGDRQSVARVGIICVHGIGSSYLLASQVKRAFGAKVVVEVGWHGDREKWRQYDLLVSTSELPDAGQPVVVVPPMLGGGDIGRVGDALESLRLSPETPEAALGVFLNDLNTLENLAAGAKSLVERFSLTIVHAATAPGELPLVAGRLFGATPEAASAIAWELTAREAIATQAIPELGIILLHCRTKGVDAPLFSVLRPYGGVFTAPGISGLEACVVMLLPAGASRECAEMMGRISTELVEREGFLGTVRTGAANAVLAGVDRVLAEHLFQFTVHRLKG